MQNLMNKQGKILKKIKPTLLVITGPTAIGKTSLSIALANHFSCPVISADSRQFFQEMHIGTAKPTMEEMRGVPHYFINSHSITENYNVGKFENEAIELLEKLFQKHDFVVMAGGSGLYINAVCHGFDELPEANEEVRKKVNDLYKKEGLTGLQHLLKQLDPVYYEQVDIQNPQRISRALEVCLISNASYSGLRLAQVKERNFNILKIGLNTSRETLYDRINQRVDLMMKQGLLKEVEELEKYKQLNALQTVGYKELFDVLPQLRQAKDDPEHYQQILKKAVESIKQNTRRFAKRQLTWFRRDEHIKWFEPTDLQGILTYISQQRITFP